MLERCFKSSSTLHRLRGGPAGPFLAGLAQALADEGYQANTIVYYVRAGEHLAVWADRHGTALPDLDDALVARFVLHLPRCRCCTRRARSRSVPFMVHRFVRYLRETGVVTTPAAEPMRSPLMAEYGAWMRDQRGLAATTIARSLRMVQALLDTMGDDPAEFDATGVRGFVLEHIRKHAPASAGLVTTGVRCFLRWLVAQGRCPTDLAEAVPKVPTWRLAKLPRYLADDDVERIIKACVRPSPVARRDRAMLLLLARLGLRASDVVGLRLGDIDWRQARIRVVGKGKRETRLPLPQDVGDAILAYLEAERHAAATDRVFLTARTPIRPIGSSGLRGVTWRAIERAGVQVPSRGTHVLRHSLATKLLREGVTLDAIGAVLRHRDVNTTALYAKVDIAALRQVAQPWPCAEDVSPC